MSHQSPPESTVIPRKRVYMACVHCRKRKVRCITEAPDTPCERCARKALRCEYLSVSNQPDAPPMNLPPQLYGGYNTGPSPQCSIPHAGSPYYNPMNAMASGSQRVVPPDPRHDRSSHSQYAAPVQHPGCNQSIHSRTQYRPTIPDQQHPIGQGYHVDYNQLFPDPVLINVARSNRQVSHSASLCCEAVIMPSELCNEHYGKREMADASPALYVSRSEVELA
ncbi:hypothetical protein B0H17DRAFT_1144290 [Mycena rosella]|uniref:Zn(2)-C6 fungal-type domain-containing protein n=1 Tax=Mycena rosella TaxID=1033263 RepID=A0AAD7CSZ5_MYCRO|nr:hypothetical protein B0H17DRAFT_1144290 [Mycena rosella]